MCHKIANTPKGEQIVLFVLTFQFVNALEVTLTHKCKIYISYRYIARIRYNETVEYRHLKKEIILNN